jgi:hypothetical protein
MLDPRRWPLPPRLGLRLPSSPPRHRAEAGTNALLRRSPQGRRTGTRNPPTPIPRTPDPRTARRRPADTAVVKVAAGVSC